MDVVTIPGDGIGPEIMEATCRVLDEVTELNYLEYNVGQKAQKQGKDPLPEDVLAAIDETGVVLKGPVRTPVGMGFRSINVALRKHFDLFANLRPARQRSGIPVPHNHSGVDIVVFRENTEGAYSGLEHLLPTKDPAAMSIIFSQEDVAERLAHYACEWSLEHDRNRITIVHKANILKETNGLFLDTVRDVVHEYDDLRCDSEIVDAATMKLMTDPHRFDVIVTTNLFGDIISDGTAGLVGGLGVAPSANIGTDHAIFEGVHGAAPDIAGTNKANPSALMLAADMMLDRLNRSKAARCLRSAVNTVLKNGPVTADIGGEATTDEFTDAVCRAINDSTQQ